MTLVRSGCDGSPRPAFLELREGRFHYYWDRYGVFRRNRGVWQMAGRRHVKRVHQYLLSRGITP